MRWMQFGLWGQIKKLKKKRVKKILEKLSSPMNKKTFRRLQNVFLKNSSQPD